MKPAGLAGRVLGAVAVAFSVLAVPIPAVVGPTVAAPVPQGAAQVRADGPAIVRARAVALLLSGLEGGSLRSEVRALPLPGTGATAMPVIVEIDGSSFAGSPAPEPQEPLELEVILYALAPGGEVAASATHRLTLDRDVHGERLAASGVRLLTALDLSPGEYDLRLLVEGGGEMGLRRFPLSLPASRASCLWIVEDPSRWLLALPSPRHLRGVETLPLAAGEGSAVPAALPVLVEGEPWTAWLLLPAVADAAVPRSPVARLLPLSPGSGPRQRQESRPIGSPSEVPATSVEGGAELRIADGAPAEAKLRALRLTFPPLDLPPGRYALTLAVEGTEGQPPLTVWIAEAGADAVWSRLEEGWIPPARETPPPPPQLPATTARLPAEEIRAGYRQALGHLAANADAAVVAVEELERRAFDPAVAESLGAIDEAEWSVLEELLAADPEAAPPVVWLHARMALQRRSGSALLAEHAGRLGARLAEAYAAAAATPEARRLAARALASLAGERWEENRTVTARDLFRRALELDGDQPACLLGLAAVEEQTGRWAAAVPPLERLVELRPEDAEGRLRLAVNLMRTGELRRGYRLLQDLAAEREPAWIISLAHQELARELLRRDECGRAEVVLRHAAARWPRRSEITVQLSFALECQGRRSEARRLAAELIAGAGDSPPSDRYLYTRPSVEGLAPVRVWLAAEAERRLAVLGRALAEVAAGPATEAEG